jgi:AcrR family transcriptional regulator
VAGLEGGEKKECKERSVVKGNKERILETAKRLFGELGYAETTYKRIAQEAGVADGLIAHHYGSKENLFQLVEITILEDLLGKIDDSLYYASDGLSSVINFAKCILKASTTPESGLQTLLRCSPFLANTLDADNSGILAVCSRVVSKMLRCIETGIRDGSIRPDIDPILAASVIFSTVFGSTRARLLAGENILGLSFSDDFYPEILSILTKYLEPRPTAQAEG